MDDINEVKKIRAEAGKILENLRVRDRLGYSEVLAVLTLALSRAERSFTERDYVYREALKQEPDLTLTDIGAHRDFHRRFHAGGYGDFQGRTKADQTTRFYAGSIHGDSDPSAVERADSNPSDENSST